MNSSDIAKLKKNSFSENFYDYDKYQSDKTNKNFLSKSSSELSANVQNLKINISKTKNSSYTNNNSSINDTKEPNNIKTIKKKRSNSMKKFFKSSTDIEHQDSFVSDSRNKNNFFRSFRTLNPIKKFKFQFNNVNFYETREHTNQQNPTTTQDDSKRIRFKNLFTIALTKHFSHSCKKAGKPVNDTATQCTDADSSINCFEKFLDGNTCNKNTNFKNKKSEDDFNQKVLNDQILADCRTFDEKKNEINDLELNNYLEKSASKIRRNAICEKIDKLENNKQLLNFMEYLLREDYIKNFLL